MKKRALGLILAIVLVFLLSGTCLAAEKPIGDITSTQQVIDKLFAGRTLDNIEGIWVKDPGTVIAVVKASLVTIKSPDYKNSDYIGIVLKGKEAGWIYISFKKTEYDFSFNSNNDWYYENGPWKLLTPTLLQFDGKRTDFGYAPTRSFIRVYPTP